MGKSKVFFTDFRTKIGVSQCEKLKKLIRKAGIKDIDFEGKFTAIKMHFGELGNCAYIRPNYVRAVVDIVKELGGVPFLTDSNTLYPGSRNNAVRHLECAEMNGFNSVTTGCHVIIGDGLKGTDEVEVTVPNGEYCNTALIGKAVMDADVFISLSHFKGHEDVGFGGALKNIGMGCGSRAGKMHMHSEGTPEVDQEMCRGCKQCTKVCGSNAISYGPDRKAYIEPNLCKGCGRCITACNFDAIDSIYDTANEILCCKIAEYTQAVCYGRPCFHISLIMDVSPNCDCHDENDAPILPNIGMLASFDPVALDQACADLCLKATPIRNSQLGDNLANPKLEHHHDHFKDNNPNIRWKEALEHGEKIGLGSRDYELCVVK
ncbi:DUF362 domain-containing protein [Oribacterium sp. NK2B42]|uniref:DUF362 domain-containing protein n=1 Tax=Oribacterium sp. NK2B42 TaxID=689781 RepID=UPI0004068E20|nr:DUF362 domain-containing protein [Oribacterium sp. NK2B42]